MASELERRALPAATVIPRPSLMVGLEIVRLFLRGIELAIEERDRERGELVDGVVVDED